MDTILKNESIVSGAAYQYVNSLIFLFSGTIFYIYSVRIFTTEIVGSIALFLGLSTLFSMIFGFGINNGMKHFISYYTYKNENVVVSDILYTFTVIGLILASVSFMTMWALSRTISIYLFHTAAYEFPLKILGINLASMTLNGILNGMLLGLHHFKRSAIVSIVASISTYTLPFIMISQDFSFSRLVIGLSVGNCIGSALYIFTILSSNLLHLRIVRKQELKTIFAYSSPLFISSLVGLGASYVDRFTVAFFMSLSSIGIYNFSLLIASSLTFMVVPMNNILLPKFSQFYSLNDTKMIRKIVRLSTNWLNLIYVPVSLGLSAASPLIISLLAGNDYGSSSTPLSIILFSMALFVSINPLIQAVASIRNTKILILSTSMGLMSNFLLSLLLIPKYGLIGAAMSYSTIFAIPFLVLYFSARNLGVASFDTYTIAKIWVSALSMYIVILYLGHFFEDSALGLFAEILAASLIYLLMIRITRAIKKDQFDMLNGSTSGVGSFVKKTIKKLLEK